MKRSEYVNLVNEIAQAEAKYLADEVKKARETSEPVTYLMAFLCTELPSMSARIAASIIEKSGAILFDPE